MVVKEVEYPTATRKFFVEDKGNSYTCYIYAAFNYMEDFVVKGFVTDKNKIYDRIADKDLEWKIISKCKGM